MSIILDWKISVLPLLNSKVSWRQSWQRSALALCISFGSAFSSCASCQDVRASRAIASLRPLTCCHALNRAESSLQNLQGCIPLGRGFVHKDAGRVRPSHGVVGFVAVSSRCLLPLLLYQPPFRCGHMRCRAGDVVIDPAGVVVWHLASARSSSREARMEPPSHPTNVFRRPQRSRGPTKSSAGW